MEDKDKPQSLLLLFNFYIPEGEQSWLVPFRRLQLVNTPDNFFFILVVLARC
jgi:hypothetical protein